MFVKGCIRLHKNFNLIMLNLKGIKIIDYNINWEQ